MKYFFRGISACIAVCFMSVSLSFAQERMISGTVLSGESAEPLPGVTVMIVGSSRGATTDLDGKYNLPVRAGDESLRFSYIGYKTVTIAINAQTVMDITMEPDFESLEELIVIGYGVVRKSDLTGSVSSIKSEDITKIPAANPAQALQGKIAGVQVNAASGAPGAQPVIRVRGVGTFNNSSPVFVVDGVILDDISFLTAADIESMEVLKDASAIAIYGSRGANGVILITTKRGKEGKTVIQVNSEYSIQTVPNPISLLNGSEFATIVNEISPGSYNNVNAVPNTDWQALLFNPAPIQNHQVSASGSKEGLKYFFSVGYFGQTGIIDKSNFERLTIRMNNEYQLNKFLKVGNNLTIVPSKQQNTAGGAVFQAYRAQPLVNPFNDDNSYAEVPGVGNPLAAIEYTNSFNNSMRTVGNVFAEAEIIDGLSVRSSFGVDLNNNKSQSFTPVYFVSPQQNNPISRLNKGFGEFSTLLWENTISYNKVINDKHRIGSVAGFTMQNTQSEFFSIGAENLLREDPDFWYINPNNVNPNLINNSVDFGQNYSMVSYLARVNYSYDDRYMLTASYRLDGSSKFAAGNRFAGFPALAAGWNLMNESFLTETYAISNFKLRASWGATGNDRVAFDRIYSRVLNQIDGVFGQDPALFPGATYGVLGNPDLVWETTYQSDIGLELGFFNNKLTAEFDYFRRVTEDILVDLAVPGFLGNGQGARITYNAGSVLNSGFEFNVSYQDQVGDLKYRVGVLGNTLHNEVLAISGIDGEGDELIGGDVFGRFVTRSTVGLPIGYFYGYQVDGIFQNQQELDAYPSQNAAGVGDLRFVDNGDGVIDLDDRVMIGSPIPSLIYGFSFELNYKGFGLNADIQGEYGKDIYNAKEAIRPDLYNFESHVLDRWTGEGTSTTMPRSTAGGYNWQPSSRFVQDGSFLRLRNLTFSYNLSQTMANNLKLQNARIYLSGTNVFTLTRFTGYSPEFASGNVLSNGLDYGGYPVTAIYSIGCNLTF